MTTLKAIDRKTFLTSTLTWAALALSGCSDSGSSAGTGGTGGGAGTGGTGGTGGAGGSAGTTGGSAGASAGGDAGSGGTASSTMCSSTVEPTNNHTHVLTVPGSDVDRGFQDAPYVLEAGATGHTHTLTLTAYDFAYLQAGVTLMARSSMDSNHDHQCDITCTA
jgi:hypothetical protein